MTYASSTIGSIISAVNQTHLLPAIQRPFVWSSAQVIALFDSLLKGYPISSFMFWSLKDDTKSEVRCYKFLENYRPEVRNEVTTGEGRKVVLVLDGQQRLTSLLIGLRGTFTEKAKGARKASAASWIPKTLYLDLVKDPTDADAEGDNDLGITYGLAFHERRPVNNARHHWFKLGSMLDYEGSDRLELLVTRVLAELPEKVSAEDRQLGKRPA